MTQTEAQLFHTTLSPRGILKVSLPVWMANPAFARLLAAFHERNPEVTLDLDLSGRKVNLVVEGFDLALRVALTLDDSLIAKRLATIRFVMIGAPQLLDKLGRRTASKSSKARPFSPIRPWRLTVACGSAKGRTPRNSSCVRC